MSAIQLRWLTTHFAQGKISREEFETLYFRVANSQKKEARTKNAQPQRKVLRLHPVTRRVLTQIRVFKIGAKLSSYLIMLAMMSFIYIAIDFYKTNGTLSNFSLAAVESYLTQVGQQNLPTDIKQAADFLANESRWTERHIYQFLEQWQSLELARQQEYQKQEWFRSFNLALSLQIADQRALIKKGDKKALQRKLLLSKLSEKIEGAV